MKAIHTKNSVQLILTKDEYHKFKNEFNSLKEQKNDFAMKYKDVLDTGCKQALELLSNLDKITELANENFALKSENLNLKFQIERMERRLNA